jgi:hypothetical protein
MAASMPVRRPGRKSRVVTSCPKDTHGAQLHKRSAEASGFDSTARIGRNRYKERTPWLVGSVGFDRTMTIGKTTASRLAVFTEEGVKQELAARRLSKPARVKPENYLALLTKRTARRYGREMGR